MQSTHQNTRHQPDDRRQETESFRGLPAAAIIAVGDSTPVEDPTTGQSVERIDEEPEGRKPA